jgi:hypothetical protein
VPGDYDNGSATRGLQFPTLAECASDPSKVIHYRDRIFSKLASYRRRLEARLSVNYQYLIDNQWLDLVSQAVADPQNQIYALRMLQDLQDGTPRPVTNILTPNVEIELATYNKRKFMPKVEAVSNDPWDVHAAKKMGSVLRSTARDVGWDAERQRVALHVVAAGTGGLRAAWDQDYMDTEDIASPFAVQCQVCKQIVASDTFPMDLQGVVKYNSETLGSVPDDPLSIMLTDCPNCDARGSLQPAQMNEADRGKRDLFGRSAFVKVPKGKPSIEAYDPFRLYPENGGVGVTVDTFRAMHTVTPRSLDWIADRHPQFESLLRPDHQIELIRRNPLLGEFSSFVWLGPTLDTNVYTNHANYFEMIHVPSRLYPQGALIRSCNSLILQAEPLIWDYVDQTSGFKMSAARVEYACGNWFERPGEFFGHGMIDRGRSLQNRVNGLDAIVTDIHDRMANPHVLAATDMNVSGPEWFQGRYAGKKMQYERSVLDPSDKPTIFGGTSAPSGLFQVRSQLMGDVRFVLGPAEIEQGQAPKNISTTSGLQLASENAEQRRGPREDVMDRMSTKVWEAIMKMKQAFQVSESSYEEEDPVSKRWRKDVYTRTVLRGSFRLTIEKTAYVAQSIYNREAAREAQADGLYVVQKPADRKKLLELRGLPTDINEDENHQVDCANEKWFAFLKSGTIPALDVTLDNAPIHSDVFSTHLQSDEGKRLAVDANWSKIVPLLTDWMTLLEQRVGLDHVSRKVYGMWTSEQDAVQMYAQQMVQYQQAQSEYPMEVANYDSKAPAMIAAGIQPPLQPVEPVKPIFLPRPVDLKILTVWKELLEKVPVAAPPNEDAEKYAMVLDRFLRFRAVREAYLILAVPPPWLAMPSETPMPMSAAGPAGAPPTGNPPESPNPPNPVNTPSPGTSQALSNATTAATTPPGGA